MVTAVLRAASGIEATANFLLMIKMENVSVKIAARKIGTARNVN
jgi:hypothetical protein